MHSKELVRLGHRACLVNLVSVVLQDTGENVAHPQLVIDDEDIFLRHKLWNTSSTLAEMAERVGTAQQNNS
jgi:hypothetical protein